MKFSKLARYLEKLEKTSSRNEITKILAELFKEADGKEIDRTCYLLLGELVPAYRGLEFNIAEKMMIQILALAYRKQPEKVARLYKSKGDLGDAACELAASRRGVKEKVSVEEVYERLYGIAMESGEGSQERKIEKAALLLSRLDPLSAKFVVRIPLGKLRLGFSDATLLDALSVMEKGDKSARAAIEAAYNVTADIGKIAGQIKKTGIKSLGRVRAEPGIPIRPSLAERLQDIEKIFEKAGKEVGVEDKLDGFRTQIHLWHDGRKKEIRLFSRNLENTTHMFPEITEAARELKVKSAILDGETIGYNLKTGRFAPFQETVQRKRKHDIAEFAKKIPLFVFVFDVLYRDGKPLLKLSFRERREILEKIFARAKIGKALRLAPQKITGDLEVIKEELDRSLRAGLEGLVIKKLDAPYEAGSRGFHWIKLKAATAALEKLRAGEKKMRGLPDTIDCVVMGAYRGRGKRVQFGVGGLLLGVRGRGDTYYTISRLGTGLSDAQFREVHQRIKKLKVSERPKEYVIEKDTIPDIWTRPSLVVEILADEITLSPRHTAGKKGEEGRGYSLRFPRLVRFREDKNPEDTTTVEEIEKLYKRQKE